MKNPVTDCIEMAEAVLDATELSATDREMSQRQIVMTLSMAALMASYRYSITPKDFADLQASMVKVARKVEAGE